MERGVVVTNGNGWQKPAIAGLWALVLLFLGWLWTANDSARRELGDRLEKAQASATAASLSNQERIATLEEAVRGLNRSLDRIETGVDELRKDRRR